MSELSEKTKNEIVVYLRREMNKIGWIACEIGQIIGHIEHPDCKYEIFIGIRRQEDNSDED